MKITLDELRTLIDEPYLSRGNQYFMEGLVELLSITSTQVKASAMGTRLYKVALMREGNFLKGTCSCPAFEDFGPCKHMAATGFAVMQQAHYTPSRQYTTRAAHCQSIERTLLKQTKQELVALILDLANDYPEIIEMLDEE